MRAVTLYRLSGLAVQIGMTIEGIASILYSRAGGSPSISTRWCLSMTSPSCSGA
jgi:hypothetical protein